MEKRETLVKGGASATPRQTPRSTRITPRSFVGSVTHRRLNFPPNDDMSFFNTLYAHSESYGDTSGFYKTIQEIRQAQDAPYSTNINSGRDIYNLMHHLRVHRDIIAEEHLQWKLPIKLFRKVLKAYSGHTGHEFDKFGTFIRSS